MDVNNAFDTIGNFLSSLLLRIFTCNFLNLGSDSDCSNTELPCCSFFLFIFNIIFYPSKMNPVIRLKEVSLFLIHTSVFVCILVGVTNTMKPTCSTNSFILVMFTQVLVFLFLFQICFLFHLYQPQGFLF